MPQSPSPAFFRLNYNSSYGPHSAEVPTTFWFDTPSTGGHGVFNDHSTGSTDADAMINDFVDAIVPFFPNTVTLANYTIYTQADAGANPIPQTSNVLTQVGTSGTPGWSKAVQATMIWRTAAAGLFKVVMLDAASGNNFDPLPTPAGNADIIALDALVTDTLKGFMGRDNARPATFIGFSRTLNEKLRRAYRMT